MQEAARGIQEAASLHLSTTTLLTTDFRRLHRLTQPLIVNRQPLRRLMLPCHRKIMEVWPGEGSGWEPGADDRFSDGPGLSSVQEFTENRRDRGCKAKQEQRPDTLRTKKPSETVEPGGS